MSDLNQLIGSMKSGQGAPQYAIEHFLNLFGQGHDGPICCFYTGQFKEVVRLQRYFDPKDLISFALNKDEEVVGCSRGVLPFEEWAENPGLYRERLCTGCVEEARTYIPVAEDKILAPD